MASPGQAAEGSDLKLGGYRQQGFRVQAAEVDAIGVYPDHVDVVRVVERRTTPSQGVKGLADPVLAVPGQVQTPHEFPFIQTEGQQGVEACGGQEQQVVPSTDLVAVPEVGIPVGALQLKVRGIAEQLVAGGDPQLLVGEFNAPQSAVPAPSREIDFSGVPVDFLFDLLVLEIDEVDTAVALAFFGAAHHRGGNEFGQSHHQLASRSCSGSSGSRISLRPSRLAPKRCQVATAPL